MIEREGALAWLEERFTATSTMPGVAHLLGDAGMGKTRVLRAAAAAWTARGARVVVIGPDPAAANPVAGAVRQAIAELVSTPPEDGEALPLTDSVLLRATPKSRGGLALLLGRDDTLSAKERRAAIAEALRWALEEAADRSGRVVLAIDDMDSVDGASRNAFADVLGELPAVPALLVATYMPDARPAPAPEPVETWRLAPLSAEYIAARTDLGPLGRQRPLSPLHLGHVAAWTRETSEPPPQAFGELLARRIARLPAEARDVLQALAILGDEAIPANLDELTSSPRGTAAPLAMLLRAGFVREQSGRVSVSHAVVRQEVLSRIEPLRGQELCARAAALRPQASLELRARWAVRGGSALEALALLDAVSAKRFAHGDLEGCVSALRRALDLSRRELQRGELDDPVTAILVFARKLAEALAAAERWADAEGVLHEALGLAPPASEHRAHLLSVLAQVAHSRSHLQDARRYLDEAMRAARQSDLRGLLPVLERLDRIIDVA